MRLLKAVFEFGQCVFVAVLLRPNEARQIVWVVWVYLHVRCSDPWLRLTTHRGLLEAASDRGAQCARICVTLATHDLPAAPMAPKKTTTLNLRIDPALKDAARVAALQDHRSVANLIELLIRRHCAEAGISIPEQPELFEDADDE